MWFLRLIPAFALFVGINARLDARQPIGTFVTWAAFCDGPKQCFAISQPDERQGPQFLTIAFREKAIRVQAHFRRPVRAATLTVGDATYALTAVGQDAVADPGDGLRIAAAIRDGDRMSVVATATDGRRLRQHYRLAGAPSAIDAAAVASAR